MPLPIGGPVYVWTVTASAGVDGSVMPGAIRCDDPDIGLAEPGPDLTWRAPPPPTAEDWVLILTRP